MISAAGVLCRRESAVLSKMVWPGPVPNRARLRPTSAENSAASGATPTVMRRPSMACPLGRFVRKRSSS